MSIIADKTTPQGRYVKDSATILKANPKKDVLSAYTPNEVEKVAINSFLKDFRQSWQTMHLPRPEFNDMSLYQRHIVDMLAFNTYQENDGNPMMEDRLGGWKSNAIRPIIRNKAISIAAHMTSRLLVPKIFAYNDADDEQEESARVMSYLVDWAREQANYPHMALFRVIAALYSPISWGYSEYVEVYRKVRNDNGGFKEVLDEDESGFKHLPISTDQVYFPNFYERDCQKQDFIIMRRIISYDKFKAKYPESRYPNAKHVTPGIVVVMDDANRGFYQVYDPHMRGEEVEEVIRWRKNARNDVEVDSRMVMVNGVMLEMCANPRADHQFPFDAFYYLPINERCIAGKSLVFALQSDTTIVNTLYQLYIDGEYLKRFPPVITTGSDKVGVDVFVPGLNLAFADENVKINPINNVVGDSVSIVNALEKVEASVSESSQGNIQQGQETPGTPSTAYEISRIEQNASTVLGLSLKFMAGSHIIPYGKLLVSDVLQYMTIPDAEKIVGNDGLIYKTFYAKEPGVAGKQNKVSFDSTMPDTMTDEEKMDMSFKLLEAQGGMNSSTTLWKVNPVLFREFKYTFAIDADVLNPRSAELSRAFSIELFDRAIAHPETFDSKEIGKILLSTDPVTSKNPDSYMAKLQNVLSPIPGMGATENTPGMGSAPKPNAPTQGNQLPQSMGK